MLRFVLVLLLVAFAGCRPQVRNDGRPQLSRLTFEETYQQLLPEAIDAVAKLTGETPVATLEFVDELPGSDVSPALAGARALRVGDKIFVKRLKELQVDEMEAYDTLCHELLHITTNARTSTQSEDGVDVLRVHGAFSEAISWRFATELTARKYGLTLTPESYTWDFIPFCRLPREFVVDVVMNNPDAAIMIARHEDAAEAVLRRFTAVLAER